MEDEKYLKKAKIIAEHVVANMTRIKMVFRLGSKNQGTLRNACSIIGLLKEHPK